MAGEWIPVDIALGSKPEVQELVDLSGQSVEVVVYRLLQLWGWASLNSSDGTARATPERLARICGGCGEFWKQVERVGWIEFDEAAGTATIPGWGRRFSMAAKSRALKNDRQKRYNGARMALERHASATTGEDTTDSSPSARGASLAEGSPEPQEVDAAAWAALLGAWNEGRDQSDPERWRSPKPPQAASSRLSEDGWLDRAREAIRRLPRCRYFRTAVTLPQICQPGFVDRVIGGQYDSPRERRDDGRRGPDERPPAQGWSGADLEAYRRTQAKLLREAAG